MNLLKLLIFILLVLFIEYTFKFTNIFVTKEGFDTKFSFTTKEHFSDVPPTAPGCYINSKNCTNEYWKKWMDRKTSSLKELNRLRLICENPPIPPLCIKTNCPRRNGWQLDCDTNIPVLAARICKIKKWNQKAEQAMQVESTLNRLRHAARETSTRKTTTRKTYVGKQQICVLYFAEFC